MSLANPELALAKAQEFRAILTPRSDESRISDPELATAKLRGMLPLMRDIAEKVTRRFHWVREGPRLRAEAVNLIEEHVAVAAVLAHRAGRTAQVQARARVLGGLIEDLARDGVDHLIIESRRPRDDGRDRSVLLGE